MNHGFESLPGDVSHLVFDCVSNIIISEERYLCKTRKKHFLMNSWYFLLSRFDGCSNRPSAENMVPVEAFVVPRFTLWIM